MARRATRMRGKVRRGPRPTMTTQRRQRCMECIHAPTTIAHTTVQESGRQPWKRGSMRQARVRAQESSPSGSRCRNEGIDQMSMSVHTKLVVLRPAQDNRRVEPIESRLYIWLLDKALQTGSNDEHAQAFRRDSYEGFHSTVRLCGQLKMKSS